MPTFRQEKLAEAIIENAGLDKPKTMGEVLEKVGYAPTTAGARPGEVIEAKGVQEALMAKGFTVEAADDLVQKILHKEEAQDKDRLKAADMMYERLGAKAPQKSINLSFTADAKDFEQYEQLSGEFDEKMKRKMLE